MASSWSYLHFTLISHKKFTLGPRVFQHLSYHTAEPLPAGSRSGQPVRHCCSHPHLSAEAKFLIYSCFLLISLCLIGNLVFPFMFSICFRNSLLSTYTNIRVTPMQIMCKTLWFCIYTAMFASYNWFTQQCDSCSNGEETEFFYSFLELTVCKNLLFFEKILVCFSHPLPRTATAGSGLSPSVRINLVSMKEHEGLK